MRAVACARGPPAQAFVDVLWDACGVRARADPVTRAASAYVPELGLSNKAVDAPVDVAPEMGALANGGGGGDDGGLHFRMGGGGGDDDGEGGGGGAAPPLAPPTVVPTHGRVARGGHRGAPFEEVRARTRVCVRVPA